MDAVLGTLDNLGAAAMIQGGFWMRRHREHRGPAGRQAYRGTAWPMPAQGTVGGITQERDLRHTAGAFGDDTPRHRYTSALAGHGDLPPWLRDATSRARLG